MRYRVNSRAKLAAVFIGSVLSIFLTSIAMAAGGGAHAPGLGTLFWPAANFAVYLWIGIRIYRSKVTPLLKDRSMQIARSIEESASLLVDAENKLELAKQRLDDVEGLRSEVIAELQREAEIQSDNIITKAHEDSKRVGDDAARRISGDLRKAKEDVRLEVVALATEYARAELSSSLSQADDERMRSEAVRSLVSS